MDKKLFFRLFLVLTLAIFVVAGCATTKNTGTAIKEGATAAGKEVGDKAEDVGGTVQDASITSAIKMKFANDEMVSASAINVDTKDGHVTLTGTVDSQAALDHAVELAREVNAVKSVHPNLTITGGSKK
jgi:osmotically-inducible protein OsmY